MHSTGAPYSKHELYREAEQFVEQCYRELDIENQIDARLEEIWHEIGRSGHYEHTTTELVHGARMAWRNSNRCIGRYFWDSLHVRDRRPVTTADDVFEELCGHIEYATNDGTIRPTVTVFRPAVRNREFVRIWNYQLIRYAGYENDAGIMGDPDSLELTAYCQSRGWEGDGTRFDVLPLVIQIREQQPRLFELDPELLLEVPLTHPEYDWFADLDLRWYAVPIVSDMCLEIGGIRYTAAPFNGWYMGTEIGARNLVDRDRYDIGPVVGEQMGLDTSRDRSLWLDRSIIEVNRAVLHSFDRYSVRIVDHHTAARQFNHFEEQETEVADRSITGDWTWLIPPVSPATTHIFHKKYDSTVKRPNFFYQDAPYETEPAHVESSV